MIDEFPKIFSLDKQSMHTDVMHTIEEITPLFFEGFQDHYSGMNIVEYNLHFGCL